jgi:hypothetical protein
MLPWERGRRGTHVLQNNVTVANLASISITPASQSISSGVTQQYTAVGILQNRVYEVRLVQISFFTVEFEQHKKPPLTLEKLGKTFKRRARLQPCRKSPARLTALLNNAKVMSSSQVELPNAAEAELRGK